MTRYRCSFWLAVLLTGIGTGVAAAALTRLLEMVQHVVWNGSGTHLLDAAGHAGAWRHVLVLLGRINSVAAGQAPQDDLPRAGHNSTTVEIGPCVVAASKEAAPSMANSPGGTPGQNQDEATIWPVPC
jgi:hypothetical protein